MRLEDARKAGLSVRRKCLYAEARYVMEEPIEMSTSSCCRVADTAALSSSRPSGHDRGQVVVACMGKHSALRPDQGPAFPKS